MVNDTILTTISSIFNKKVGDAFTSEELIQIEKEGEERYKKKIPPGFKDSDKGENKFGDLIIWKELMRKSKLETKPFIFVIDDLKEDWWLRTQGQTISPRQELAQELYTAVQQTFHLYTPDRFLEFSSKTQVVKQETIDEVRDIHFDHYVPFNGLPKNPFYPTTDIANILKTNEIFKNMNSLPGLARGFSSPITINEILKNNKLLTNLNTIKAINDLQKSLNRMSKSPSTEQALDEQSEEPLKNDLADNDEGK